MDKKGRDIVNSVAASGGKENNTQAMETTSTIRRTNAPTRKYCRVSAADRKRARENEHPNIVVLVRQTMVKAGITCGNASGAEPRDQHALFTGYMIRFVPGPERLAQLVCIDAAKIAEHKWLYYRLGELGLDRLSTEGAAERNNAIAPDIAAPLIAAVVKATGIVKLETIEPMITNKAAFKAALEQLHVMPLNPVAA